MGGKAKGKTSGTEGAAPTASNPAEDALNSVLDGLDTPEEKLAALSAKFLELHKDLRRTSRRCDEAEGKVGMALVERDAETRLFQKLGQSFWVQALQKAPWMRLIF